MNHQDIELMSSKEDQELLLHETELGSEDLEAQSSSLDSSDDLRVDSNKQDLNPFLEQSENPYDNKDITIENVEGRSTLGKSHKSQGSRTSNSSRAARKASVSRVTQQQYRRPIRHEPKLVRFVIILFVPAVILLGLFFVISWSSPAKSRSASPKAAPTGSVYPSGFDIKNNWGSYSPYFDSGTNYEGIDGNSAGHGEYSLPDRCTYTQVHVLHRHAQRYPTEGDLNQMKDVYTKLKAMTEPPTKVLEWITGWKLTLGSELLVANGVATEFDAGAQFWSSHGRLLYNATQAGYMFYDESLNKFSNGSARPSPVLRATTQSRIKTSAIAWAAGFFGAYGDRQEAGVPYEEKSIDELYDLVLLEERPQSNNTLAGYYSCPNGNNASYSSGHERSNTWKNIYLQDAATRLQRVLPGYGNFTTQDAFVFQSLCTYETAAYGSSGFCELFTETEWRGYEYSHDLAFYGESSFGSVIGAAEGVGYVYELLSRLKGQLITKAEYGVNVTLTNNEKSFPIGQPFYLDMSHDSVLVSVLTALGLSFLKPDLSPTKIPVPRQFIISRLTPFGARIYTEILGCGDDFSERYARIKVNNRIIPLDSLSDCPEAKDGLCPLDKFIKSLEKAVEAVDFDTLCYGVPDIS